MRMLCACFGLLFTATAIFPSYALASPRKVSCPKVIVDRYDWIYYAGKVQKGQFACYGSSQGLDDLGFRRGQAPSPRPAKPEVSGHWTGTLALYSNSCSHFATPSPIAVDLRVSSNIHGTVVSASGQIGSNANWFSFPGSGTGLGFVQVKFNSDVTCGTHQFDSVETLQFDNVSGDTAGVVSFSQTNECSDGAPCSFVWQGTLARVAP